MTRTASTDDARLIPEASLPAFAMPVGVISDARGFAAINAVWIPTQDRGPKLLPSLRSIQLLASCGLRCPRGIATRHSCTPLLRNAWPGHAAKPLAPGGLLALLRSKRHLLRNNVALLQRACNIRNPYKMGLSGRFWPLLHCYVVLACIYIYILFLLLLNIYK